MQRRHFTPLLKLSFQKQRSKLSFQEESCVYASLSTPRTPSDSSKKPIHSSTKGVWRGGHEISTLFRFCSKGLSDGGDKEWTPLPIAFHKAPAGELKSNGRPLL